MITTENIIPHIPETVPTNLDIGAEVNPGPSTEDLYDDLELQRYKIDWLKRKEAILQLVNICKQSHQHKKIAKRLLQCGCFHQGYEIDGKLKMFNAFHCRCRACPQCQQHRKRQRINKFRNWIRPFLQQYSNLVFIYLSVGYQNVPIDQVSQMNKQLHKGLARLFRPANTKLVIDGSVTFFHFTISDDAQIHFDTHSIIAFDPSVCDADKYYNKAFWADLIQKRFKLDYWPDVKVERIGLRSGNLEKELIKAFCYGARPLDFSIDSRTSKSVDESITLNLIDGLASSHAIVPTGLFRTFPKTVPQPVSEELKPVMEIWMGEKMIVNDLRKKTNSNTK
jgi:hypothetical protein